MQLEPAGSVQRGHAFCAFVRGGFCLQLALLLLLSLLPDKFPTRSAGGLHGPACARKRTDAVRGRARE